MNTQKCKKCLHTEKRHYQPACITEGEKDSGRYIRNCLETRCSCNGYEKQEFADELCQRTGCGHARGEHNGDVIESQFEIIEDGVHCSYENCNCIEFVKER